MNNFLKALLITAIPIVALSIISVAGTLVIRSRVGPGSGVSPTIWGIGGLLWIVAIPAAIGFAIAREKQIAAGILAGIGIGFFALGATCFANLFIH